MPKLFVANTSKQHHDFAYRLAEDKNIRIETIRIGSQVCVGGDSLTHEMIAKIIEQHAPYGLRDAKTLSGVKDFVGLCYSIDKPVPMDNMLVLFEKNDVVLNDRAADRREDIAASIAHNTQAQMEGADVTLQRTEVEIEEQTKDGAPKVNEGFEVTGDGVTPRHPGRTGRRDKRGGSRSART
jgi:hypothetical protein